MRIALNLHKRDNYAFFCPVSRVHLTVDNPVAIIDRVTPAIQRGLKSRSLIDLDNTGETKSTSVQKHESAQDKKDIEPVVPVENTVQEEKPVEEPEAEVVKPVENIVDETVNETASSENPEKATRKRTPVRKK